MTAAQPLKPSKKGAPIGLRLEPDIESAFYAALEANDMSAQDALRLAAKALVDAHKRLGRIPRDMEIRQAVIGSPHEAHLFDEAKALLRRAVELDRAGYPEASPRGFVAAEDPAGYAEAKVQPSLLARRQPARRRRGVGEHKTG